jgi:hypothetical protein
MAPYSGHWKKIEDPIKVWYHYCHIRDKIKTLYEPLRRIIMLARSNKIDSTTTKQYTHWRLLQKEDIFLLLLSLFLVGCLPGCRDLSVTPAHEITYLYAAKDSEGTVRITGDLIINLENPSQLHGRWKFSGPENSQDMGAQIGKGSLEGHMEDNQFYADLHPGFRDHNVILVGDFDESKISGEWQWITIAGVTSKGDFIAIRK